MKANIHPPTTGHKLVVALGLLCTATIVAIVSWLQRPIASTAPQTSPSEKAQTGMAAQPSRTGSQRVFAESAASSSGMLPSERVVPASAESFSESGSKLDQAAAQPGASFSASVANFQITKSASGLDIALDDRATVPAIFGFDPSTVRAAETSSPNSDVIARMADRILEDFIQTVTGSSGAEAKAGPAAQPAFNSRPSLEQWEDATSRANERFRTLLGDEEFMAASRRAAKQFRQGQPR